MPTCVQAHDANGRNGRLACAVAMGVVAGRLRTFPVCLRIGDAPDLYMWGAVCRDTKSRDRMEGEVRTSARYEGTNE